MSDVSPEWNKAPVLLNTAEAAQILRVHVNTVKGLCRSNKLPAAKVGREWRICRADLLQFIERAPQIAADATVDAATSHHLAHQANLLENISDAVIATDAEHCITTWNHAAEDMFGWRAGEVLGKDIRKFLRRDYHEISVDEHYRQLWAGDRWRGRVTVWRRDGTPIEVETTALALRDAGGKDAEGEVTGHVAVSRDMTDQVRAASRLAMLRDIDLAVLAARSTREIAAAAVERLREYVGCARASVLLFRQDTGEAELLAVASSQATALPAQAHIPLAWFSITDSFLSGKYNIVHDLEAERPGEPATAALVGEGLRTLLAVPLVVDGETIGALDLADPTDLFTDAMVQTAHHVATSLAVAIQNAQLLDEAQASRERSRTLSRRLVEVQEDERRRLSRELHDESAQLMTALQLMLTRLKRDRDCPNSFQEKIDEVRQVAHTVVESLRRFAMDLRPPTLDQYGLVPALEGYVAGFQGQTGVSVYLEADETSIGRLPEHVETTLYRIVQESLSNVARHAEAHRVSISLRRRGNRIRLELSDDGKGFDLDAALRRGRLGILGMRERAEMLGGTLDIASKPRGEDGEGGGTTLQADLPYEEAENAATHNSPSTIETTAVAPAQPSDPGTSVSLSALAELARAKALTDVLNDLHSALGRLSEPREIVKVALDHVVRAIGCTLAAVMVPRDDGWEIEQVTGPHEQIIGTHYSPAQLPFVSNAADTKNVVVVDDADNDPRFDPEATRKLTTRAAVVVPLLAAEQVRAVLVFAEYAQTRHFTPAEVEFSERLQVSLSLALENADLREAERRQEQELSRRFEELETLLDLLPAGVGIAYDPECKDIRVNPALAQQLGTPLDANASLSAEEVEKRARYRVFQDERELEPHELPMQRAAATGTPLHGLQVDILREDGVTLTLLADAVPLYAADGQVRGAVSTFVDVTERRRAEEQLRLANAELESIIAAIPGGLIVYDSEGKITRMNTLAKEMLGYGENTLQLPVAGRVGKMVLAYNSDGTQTERDSYPALRALAGEVVRNEDLYIHLPGRPEKDFWGAFSAAPILGPYGRQAGAVITMTDTTKLHELNQWLAEALHSLEEREAALSLANEELQAQAEELQASAEELRQATERLEERVRERTASLEAATEQLAATNASLRQTMQALVGQMERLREQSLLLDLTHDAIFVREIDGTIRFWNRGATELYGYTAQEAQGKISHELLRTQFPQPFENIVAELEERGRWEGELTHCTRDGAAILVAGRWAVQRAADGQARSILEINHDITAYKAAEARRGEALSELQAHREQLKALSRRLVDHQERERRYVADQLYNEAGQVLAALKMHLSRSPEGEAPARRQAETQQLLDRVMQDLHHLATHLRPATLDRLGLISAVRQYAEEWGREQEIEVDFDSGNIDRVWLDDTVETAVYRVVQEALMNVAQHAKATIAAVSVAVADGVLVAAIRDNGLGFDPREALRSGATGLLGMRERAESVGGRLTVESVLGSGTSVTMEAPIDSGTTKQ